MTRKLALLFFYGIALLLAGCYKNFPVNFPSKHPAAPEQIDFTEPNLFPEGLVYDPIHKWFYVSSATRGDIGIVRQDGSYTPFITDDMLTGTNGLKVDKARQRLIVCNGPFGGPNGIGAYNLNNGARIFYSDLSGLRPGEPIFINDVALDNQGNAYATSSFSPVIYKVDPEGKASIFFQSADFTLPPGVFGFNGIQYHDKGFLLVVFSTNIVKMPVGNPAGYSFVKLDTTISPDGLLLSKDGRQLVVAHNTGGTPGDKVLSFISNDDWNSGRLSTSFSTGAVFPTTLTSDGKRVYVLYAYLNKLLSNQENQTFSIQEVPLKVRSAF